MSFGITTFTLGFCLLYNNWRQSSNFGLISESHSDQLLENRVCITAIAEGQLTRFFWFLLYKSMY